jgi:hypothetical protein
MIVITSARAGAGRRSGSAEMRVCAVVIAHLPCLPRQVLSSKGPLLGHMRPNRRKALTWRPRGLNLEVSMSRTPNASKSIFAFVARIAMR